MSINNSLALPNPLSNGTTADATQVMGDFNYLVTALNRALLDQGGSAGMNAQNTQIHNLANGTAPGDAVNLSQLGNYLPLAGGTVTGALSLSSTLAVAGAATFAALTASGLITGNAGFSGTTLSLSGAATISGAVVGSSYQFGADSDLLFQSSSNIATLRVGTSVNQAFADFVGRSSGILLSSGGNLAFGVNDVEYARLDGSGHFGIGTTSPGALLDVNGTVNLRSTLGVTGASTLAALTASGLITGNAGFSGTTLSLSGAATLSGGGTSTTPGAGDNSTNIATTAFVQTAKTPSVQSVTSAATVTPTFSNDLVDITAQAVALTLANPSGTQKNGWGIVIRIKDNGTPQTISYGTQYTGIGFTLPSTTVAGKVLLLGMVYNSGLTRWEVASTAEE